MRYKSNRKNCVCVGGGSAKVLYVAKKSVRKMVFLWVVRCRMSEIKLMDANNKLN